LGYEEFIGAKKHLVVGVSPQDGKLCCNGQDCKPVEATVLPDGNYYLPTTDEVIPADMATPSPDDRFHHCNANRPTYELFMHPQIVEADRQLTGRYVANGPHCWAM
jgi:hypothetical protein